MLETDNSGDGDAQGCPSTQLMHGHDTQEEGNGFGAPFIERRKTCSISGKRHCVSEKTLTWHATILMSVNRF